ncbi:hypothetical protein FT663_03971 [Candidozyma haemuli var. vulneris]|nr:hypothetical protein FT663_03971 [[Candida] haemuloni var. vulneris]KAF3990473.1 hypothetical protein FT662_02270 [[Candida] haemuloni var. vulneris]
MIQAWIKANLGFASESNADKPQHYEKVPVPESPSLPKGMDLPGKGRDRIVEGDSTDDTDFTFSDLFPTNPSFMLTYLSPIMPAADNRVATASVITLNGLFGLTMMCRKRNPRFGTTPFVLKLHSVLRKVAGSLVFSCSLIEGMRICLPYDPWIDEAREWRNWAIRNGDRPGWWFGAIGWYEPLSTQYWLALVSKRTSNDLIAKKKAVNKKNMGIHHNAGFGVIVHHYPPPLSETLSIFTEVRQHNLFRQKTLLDTKLKHVSELNKAERIDKNLEGEIAREKALEDSGIEIEEPELIHLPDGVTKSEWDASEDMFHMAWTRCEPWWELSQETNYEVRVIPSSRSIVFADEADH